MSIKTYIRNSTLFSIALGVWRGYFANRRGKFGYIHPTAFVRLPSIIKGIENVYLHENTHLLSNSLILTTGAKFIMKKNSGSAEGLTVVTGNHYSPVGKWFMEVGDNEKPKDLDKDVVVEEDVWLASNVTLLAGVVVRRGGVVGAGSVVRKSTPPYAIVAGNPAKVVGFRFNPEEAYEHECALYPEEERIPLETLQKNYEKFFISRFSEIKKHLSL